MSEHYCKNYKKNFGNRTPYLINNNNNKIWLIYTIEHSITIYYCPYCGIKLDE